MNRSDRLLTRKMPKSLEDISRAQTTAVDNLIIKETTNAQ